MSDLRLFDYAPAPLPVRSSDPETSQYAAAVLPLRARQKEVLCALRHMIVSVDAADVKAWLTAELGLDRERGEVASRLSELERMDPPLVRKVGVKQGRRGRPCATWGLTPAGREAAR